MEQHIVLAFTTRYHMVRSCVGQLELLFKDRGWKFGPQPPTSAERMKVTSHSDLVAFCSVVIGGESMLQAETGADLTEMLHVMGWLPLLGKLHDSDETYLGDVCWPNHRFIERHKVMAREEIFRGLHTGKVVVEMLNRLDEKKKGTERPSRLIQFHEDGHQVASLLELRAHMQLGHIEAEEFSDSVEALRRKLFTPVGKILYEDIANLKRLPSRSAVNWEKRLWTHLNFPGELPAGN